MLYALNNLRRRTLDEDEKDFVGMIYTDCDYESLSPKKLSELREYINDITPYAPYFGDALCYRKGRRTLIKSDKDIYNILRTISMVRQSVIHGADDKKMIYNTNLQGQQLREFLDEYYGNAVEKIHEGFVGKNKKNLAILFRIYDVFDVGEKKRLTREFFNYAVLKNNLNLGFSIKKIREILLECNEINRLKTNTYDSIRHKLYLLLDFVLYKHCLSEEAYCEDFVKRLRAARTDEEKERVYVDKTQELWKRTKCLIVDKLLPQMSGPNISKSGKGYFDDAWISGLCPSTDATLFSEVIYILTLFLDGKEINDLLSQLINKFDNINSFMQLLSDLGESCEYSLDYQIFNDSEKIAKELRLIKSIARMQTGFEGVKAGAYRDAVIMLGLPEADADDYIEDKFCGDDHEVRNFIINNVINSSRFKYLAKYSNPGKVRKLAGNRGLIEYVLGRIPETQINRYFESVKGPRAINDTKKKAEYLADQIVGLSLYDLEDVRQKVNRGTPEERNKETKKALVGLYLTVLYIAVKNLVNINARYVMAINALERDGELFGMNMNADGRETPDYLALTARYQKKLDREIKELEQKRDMCSGKTTNKERNLHAHTREKIYKRKHVAEYVGANSAEFQKGVFRIYRNNIAHLNAVTNADVYINDIEKVKSYFEVYHYIMQHSIVDNYKHELTPAMQKLFASVNECNYYSKDFLKVLNLPFAYNLPRYKNLSIEDLFNDRDDKSSKVLKHKTERK